jgi:hypothetical protein
MASPADDDGVARGQELLDGAASRTAREMFLLRADPLCCSRAIGGTGTAEAGGRRRQERCFFCGIVGQVAQGWGVRSVAWDWDWEKKEKEGRNEPVRGSVHYMCFGGRVKRSKKSVDETFWQKP